MTPTDDVIFKRWPNGNVIAAFPAICGNSYDPSTCSSFEHVGQHGAADVGVMANLRPALPREYADLKRELESAPYHYYLRVVRKFTRAHHRQRELECR